MQASIAQFTTTVQAWQTRSTQQDPLVKDFNRRLAECILGYKNRDNFDSHWKRLQNETWIFSGEHWYQWRSAFKFFASMYNIMHTFESSDRIRMIPIDMKSLIKLGCKFEDVEGAEITFFTLFDTTYGEEF